MFSYKLIYNSKQDAEIDLKMHNILDLDGNASGTNIDVIFLGIITKTPEIRDNNTNELISEANYYDGYHVDVISTTELNFDKQYLVYPKKPHHNIF
jgi:hypothetical protein